MQLISDRTCIMLKFLVPQRRRPNPKHAIAERDKDLSGTTVVFTGGTDGMGRVAVEMFHAMGANIVLLGRNEAKGQAVRQELTAVEARGAVTFEVCDLASMNSVQACARRVLAQHRRIDVLVNCAGAHVPERLVTQDGFEMNWAVNYLGPFLLTRSFLGRISKSAPSRIANLVTDVAWLDRLDLDDLQSKRRFNATDAYTKGKLAMAMFTRELGQQFGAEGPSVNCLNPGFIQTNLLRHQTGFEAAVQPIMRKLASPTLVGADRAVKLAVSSEYENVTGAYIFEDAVRSPHPEARDATQRAKLMEHSEHVLAPWLADAEPVKVKP